MRAKDIMTTPVITVSPVTELKEIAALLLERDISSVPVVDASGELLGIVSEADLVPLQSIPDPRRHLLPFAREPEHVPRRAEEVMTKDVVTVTQDEDVTGVARLMLERRVKRVPVVEDRTVTGIISRRDILKVLARSDIHIQAELQERLDDEIKLLGWFHARVEAGVVTLEGPDEEQARRLARLIARGIPGVVAVRFADER